jgi:hypothetical protein
VPTLPIWVVVDNGAAIYVSFMTKQIISDQSPLLQLTSALEFNIRDMESRTLPSERAVAASKAWKIVGKVLLLLLKEFDRVSEEASIEYQQRTSRPGGKAARKRGH